MANVIPIDSDRAEALRWLRSRLQWEATLNELRDPSNVEPSTAASDHPEAPKAA